MKKMEKKNQNRNSIGDGFCTLIKIIAAFILYFLLLVFLLSFGFFFPMEQFSSF